MTNSYLKKKIEAFYLKHGKDEAEKRFKEKRLSLSMIQKLRAGTYPHKPKDLYVSALAEIFEQKEKS